jgi:6-phospho-beta-glucosidase
LLGVEPSAVLLGHVGLNHLTWVRSATVDGVDVLPKLMAEHAATLRAEIGVPAWMVGPEHGVPSYYLRYFYSHDAVVAEQRSAPSRGQQVADMEVQLLALYADPGLDHKPDLLAQRGGAFYSEAAVGLIAGLTADAGGAHAANVRNGGALPFLDERAVIEVMCDVDGQGARPRPVAPLSPAQRGLVAHMSAYEELALDAALRGGRDRVARALLAHPLVGQYALAEELTDRLLAENTRYLAWNR